LEECEDGPDVVGISGGLSVANVKGSSVQKLTSQDAVCCIDGEVGEKRMDETEESGEAGHE